MDGKIKADGIIFDVDGTMWDASETLAGAWTLTVRGFGLDETITVEDIGEILGMTAQEIADHFSPRLGGLSDDIMHAALEQEVGYLLEHGAYIYEGLGDVLRELAERGKRFFVVSNCGKGYIETFFEVSGLGHYFESWECEGSTGLPKAENIKLVAERAGLKAPVYIGDTAGDERSSRRAGTAFIYASYGFGKAEAPDAVIADIRELPSLID
jgi:phosphoglycolate phosphatase